MIISTYKDMYEQLRLSWSIVIVTDKRKLMIYKELYIEWKV